MRIKVTRSGGFAGVSEELASVDTAAVAAGDEIERLVHEAGFFGLPAETGGTGADLFRYEITVTDDGREHTVSFLDDGGPETASLRALVEAIAGR